MAQPHMGMCEPGQTPLPKQGAVPPDGLSPTPLSPRCPQQHKGGPQHTIQSQHPWEQFCKDPRSAFCAAPLSPSQSCSLLWTRGCRAGFMALLQGPGCALAVGSARLPHSAAFGQLQSKHRNTEGKGRTCPGPTYKFSSSPRDLTLFFQFLIPLGSDWKPHPSHRSLSVNYRFLKTRRQWLK